MRKFYISIFFFFIVAVGFPQRITLLYLDSCFAALDANYPLAEKYEVIENERDYAVSNVGKAFLPQFDINAIVSYQSDVTFIPYNIENIGAKINTSELEIPGYEGNAGVTIYPELINVPVLPEESKVKYGVTLDIEQLIFDGGITRKKKVLTSSDYDYQLQNVDVEINKMRMQICELFYSIALLDGYIEQLNLAKDRLTSRRENVRTAVKNGVTLATDLDMINVEILKMEGTIDETKLEKKMVITNLSRLLNKKIDVGAMAVLPDIQLALGAPLNNRRVELALFEAGNEKLDAAERLYSSYWPVITGFVQGGYGNVGMNLFANKLHPFLYAGAKLNWTFWDWDKSKNEKKIIVLKKQELDIDKKTFEMGVSVTANKYLDEIERYEMLLIKDMQIIKLMENITASSESMYNNGEITFTEYNEALNAETNAKIEENTHRIMLKRAKTNYLLNYGIY